MLLKALQFLSVSLLVDQSLTQVAHQKAKILREQRFNAGDGRFGSAFAQEDGTIYREESTADGERIGQYSYIDQDGKSITVRYSAGKDGFRILEGAHVPEGANGLSSANYDPEIAKTSQNIGIEEEKQPTPRRQQQTNTNKIQTEQEFNPFINPADPTHRNLNLNRHAAQFSESYSPQQQTRRQQQPRQRSEEHTSELSHDQNSYAVFCLKKKKKKNKN